MNKKMLKGLDENLPIKYCPLCRIYLQNIILEKAEKKNNDIEKCIICDCLALIKIHIDKAHILLSDNPFLIKKKNDKFMTREYHYHNNVRLIETERRESENTNKKK